MNKFFTYLLGIFSIVAFLWGVIDAMSQHRARHGMQFNAEGKAKKEHRDSCKRDSIWKMNNATKKDNELWLNLQNKYKK